MNGEVGHRHLLHMRNMLNTCLTIGVSSLLNLMSVK